MYNINDELHKFSCRADGHSHKETQHSSKIGQEFLFLKWRREYSLKQKSFHVYCFISTGWLEYQAYRQAPTPSVWMPSDKLKTLQLECIYYVCIYVLQSRRGITGFAVTKFSVFVNFSVKCIFDLAKVPVRPFKSYSCLTSVTAAQLRWHLSNMNVIFNI